MDRILRVFPERTSFTPVGPLVQVGGPDFSTPRDVDEVHVSCCFTWHREQTKSLASVYERNYVCPVRLGGPAFGSAPDDFVPGRYVRPEFTFTSHGCSFNCPWCLVPKREGKWRPAKVMYPAPNIQDNNVLAGGKSHFRKVVAMLKPLKHIRFIGGLDCRLLTDWHIDLLRGLRIQQLLLGYDCGERKKLVQRSVVALRAAGFIREQVCCYVLAGFDGESLEEAERRALEVYEWGGLPFVQLYLSAEAKSRHTWPVKARRWQRLWARPQLIKARMKNWGVSSPVKSVGTFF